MNQIIPAQPGWSIVLAEFDRDGDKITGLHYEPVISWLLLVDESKPHMVPAVECVPVTIRGENRDAPIRRPDDTLYLPGWGDVATEAELIDILQDERPWGGN